MSGKQSHNKVLYSFILTAAANNHKLSGFKQQKLILSQSGVQTSAVSILGPNRGMAGPGLPLEAVGDDSSSSTFWGLWAFLIGGLLSAVSVFLVRWAPLLRVWNLPLPFSFGDTCECIRAHPDNPG